MENLDTGSLLVYVWRFGDLPLEIDYLPFGHEPNGRVWHFTNEPRCFTTKQKSMDI